MRNHLALILTLCSFACLVPGVTQPMLTIGLKGSVDASITAVNLDVFNKTNSILETVRELWTGHSYLVSFLILFFSIIVPLLKGLMILISFVTQNQLLKRKLFGLVKAIGKWSMADVFVVGIFLTYLSAQTQMKQSLHKLNAFGMELDVKVLFEMNSHLGSGFYFFLGYCLLSLLSLQIYPEKNLK